MIDCWRPHSRRGMIGYQCGFHDLAGHQLGVRSCSALGQACFFSHSTRKFCVAACRPPENRLKLCLTDPATSRGIVMASGHSWNTVRWSLPGCWLCDLASRFDHWTSLQLLGTGQITQACALYANASQWERSSSAHRSLATFRLSFPPESTHHLRQALPA